MEWQHGSYTLSTDLARLDFALIHHHLSEHAYWCLGIPRPTVERSFAASLCFGIYGPAGLVGWARVISDHATFAYLADVYVLPEYRGQGLSKWMMQCILAHPQLQGLRTFALLTRDAQGLYQQYGFEYLDDPKRFMYKRNPDIYKKPPKPI